MTKKIKVGIVGCGGIANGKHLPALKNIQEVELVAFCDLIIEKAVKAADEYGTKDAKTYINYKELLEDKSIDVIHVLTPNRSHSEISIDALNSGKHVLCEKPMAKSYEDAKKMVEAAKKTGKILSIGYQNRYRQDSIYLKKAVENGDLGEIYFAKAHAIRRRAVPTWGVFLNEYEQGGGSLIDIGTHALDITLWTMNNYKPKSVVGNVYKKFKNRTDCGNAWGDWDCEGFTVDDSAFAFITMENGATISLESSWALNSLDIDEAKTTLCGTLAGADMKDGLTINTDQYGKLIVTKPSLSSKGADFYVGASSKADDLEQRAFYDAVLYGKDLVVTAEQALVVTQILEAVYESSKTGKQIFFS